MKFRSSFNILVLFALLLSLLGGAVTVTPAYAASFLVGDAASLIAAITTANTNNQDDTITLTANITLTAVNNINNGLPVIFTDGGHSLTIEGAGFTISRFAGAPDFRILQIDNGANVTINDLTISGGSNVPGAGIFLLTGSTVILDNVEVTGNNNPSGRGGGIYNYAGTLTIRNGSIIGESGAPNTACTGAGVFTEGFPSATTTLDASTVSYNQSPNCAGGGFFLLYDAHLIIQNGSVVSNNLGGDPDPIPFPDIAGGGGIYASASPIITISDSTVSNNTVNCAGNIGCGGGGLKGGSSITITNSTFSNNTVNCNTSTPCGGGGIYNSAATLMTITNSTFSSNSASTNDGGGIYNHATLNITNSTFSGNSAANGGGINNQSSLTVTDSTFSGNSATNQGGGIYNLNTLTFTKSTLSGNSAVYGGGTYIAYPGTTLIENSTLSGNNATTNGSAIAIQSVACAGPNVEFRSTTIAGGTSGTSVIYAEPLLCVPGSLTMSNTIVARNSETNAFELNNGVSFIDNGNNITNDNGGNTPVGVTYHASLGLGALANNGGPTQTISLLTGSPAIDTGANCSSTDQRGVSRPQAAGCDIGAFELDSTFPTVIADSLVASYASGAGPSNFTVTFSENVYDPAGDSNNNDVTNAENYLIVEDGVNGSFDTTSCEGGLESDDIQVTITSVTYNASLLTATVNFSSAVPDGSYRLFVCGTTSIADPALNELNDGLSDYTFDFIVGTITTPSTPITASSLPNTGFASNKITILPIQPAKSAYSNLGDIWLEIPSQDIKVNIVGVPQTEAGWDVTWLGSDAGWLNGTAFPSWTGNSVITAHVTDSNGLPGPFNNLKELEYGDKIIVHLFGDEYIFEVNDSRFSVSYSTSYAFKSLQDHSYLTLITCQGYNPLTDSYIFRRIVRAVLVEVK